MTNRKSNIELLRILAAIGVIVIHYCAKYFNEAEVVNCAMPLLFIRGIFSVAVNVFLLISGYFMIEQKKNTFKFINLVIEFSLVQCFWYTIIALINGNFEILRFIYSLIPQSYFTILYCVLYILSPCINKTFNSIDKKTLDVLMISAIILFSIYPTLLDLSQEILNRQWQGLSTITGTGEVNGANLVHFILMYILGGYIRKYGSEFQISNVKLILLFTINAILLFVWGLLVADLPHYGNSSDLVYHNPLIVANACIALITFDRLNIQNKVINAISKATFMSFIINQTILSLCQIGLAAQRSNVVVLLHMVLSIGVVMGVSYVCTLLYDLLIGKFIKGKTNKTFIDLSKDM